jgi:hypothetical protein
MTIPAKLSIVMYFVFQADVDSADILIYTLMATFAIFLHNFLSCFMHLNYLRLHSEGKHRGMS